MNGQNIYIQKLTTSYIKNLETEIHTVATFTFTFVLMEKGLFLIFDSLTDVRSEAHRLCSDGNRIKGGPIST